MKPRSILDSQGSTRQAANGSGGITSSFLYDSFGDILLPSEPGGSEPLFVGHKGYAYDPDTNVYLLRSRWYDPSPGRFLSRDPLEVRPLEPNAFRYVFNLPNMLTDPSGLACDAFKQPNDTRGNSCCGRFLATFLMSTQYKAYLGMLTTAFGKCPPPNIYCKICDPTCTDLGQTQSPSIAICTIRQA